MKKLALKNFHECGLYWRKTRRTPTDDDILKTTVDFLPYIETFDNCLLKIDESIEAIDKSGDDHLLWSSMFCETAFSSYTLIRNKCRRRLQNPLLMLHIFGLLQAKRIAALDVKKIVTTYFAK